MLSLVPLRVLSVIFDGSLRSLRRGQVAFGFLRR